MKLRKALSLTLALVMCLALLPARASAAGLEPAASNNKHAQQYISDQRWADTVKSYLYVTPSGGLTRVEYIDGKVVVEDYNSQFQIQSNRSIPMELPIWGGFFAGETYNFVIFGQKNLEHSKEKEVIRVVKYTKDWQRLEACSIKGANTDTPFMFGSLRCAEYGGYLYIHTCHMMFSEHQANMLLNIRESDMEWVSGEIGLGSSSDDYSYVSHSLNQFVLVDAGGHVVTLNHGDGYPRGLAVFRSYAKAGQDKLFQKMVSAPWELGYNQYGDSMLALKFSGKVGDSNTGVAVGGFVETSSGYVMAYNYTADYSNRYANRKLYMTYVDKETLGTGYWELTTGQVGNFYNPQMVSTGLDGGYVLWQGNVFQKVYYARYKPTGGIDEVNESPSGTALSDCQPIVWNGRVVWYVTDNSAPTFYTLDSSGVTAHKTTVGGGTQPTTPTQPEQSAKKLAKAADQNITIDGKAVAFQTYVLHGTNYVKLRDIAHVLNGTGASFSVDYDNQKKSISLSSGKAYQDTGAEMSTPFAGANKEYNRKNLTIIVNGSPVELDALSMKDDSGNGYTYFKLRDLGSALGFNVSWTAEKGVYIESDKPYVG